MIRSAAEILREYGPFPGVDSVHGVTYDGQQVWFASGRKPDALAVKRNPMHVVDTRKGSVLTEDFGR